MFFFIYIKTSTNIKHILHIAEYKIIFQELMTYQLYQLLYKIQMLLHLHIALSVLFLISRETIVNKMENNSSIRVLTCTKNE